MRPRAVLATMAVAASACTSTCSCFSSSCRPSSPPSSTTSRATSDLADSHSLRSNTLIQSDSSSTIHSRIPSCSSPFYEFSIALSRVSDISCVPTIHSPLCFNFLRLKETDFVIPRLFDSLFSLIYVLVLVLIEYEYFISWHSVHLIYHY